MSFEITGKLVKIFAIESKTASFQAREFVIETSTDRYPQMVKFQLTQDKCSAVDNYAEGQDVKVYFDLRGREWNGKYFTNLNAWKVEGAGVSNDIQGVPPTVESFPTEDPFANVTTDGDNDYGDLPF